MMNCNKAHKALKEQAIAWQEELEILFAEAIEMACCGIRKGEPVKTVWYHPKTGMLQYGSPAANESRAWCMQTKLEELYQVKFLDANGWEPHHQGWWQYDIAAVIA